MTQGTIAADRRRPRRRHPRRRLLQGRDAGRHASPTPATARSRWTRRAASSPSQGNVVQPGITIPTERAVDLDQPAGPGVGDAARIRPRRRVLGQIDADALRQQGRPAGDRRQPVRRDAGLRHAAGRRAQHRRLRRPAAGQPRAGQRRGGDRNLRSDRGAARLRDERQGHHRGRPDAVGHIAT